MASTTEDLLIKIQADTGNASESIALLSKQLVRLENSMTGIRQSSSSTSKSLSSFGAAMVVVNSTIENARAAFEKVEGVLNGTIGEFRKSQDAAIRLGGTLTKMGNTDVKGAMEDFKRFAKQMQDTTTVEDDHAMSLLNIATASGLSAEKTKELIRASADLAATGKVDLTGGFNALLKTLKGRLDGVSMMLPELTHMSKEAGMAGEAITYVRRNLGGLAENELNTAAGTALQLANTLGDLGESAGELVTKFFGLDGTSKTVTETLKVMTTYVSDLAKEFDDNGIKIKSFGAALSGINFKQLAIDITAVGVAIGLAFAIFKSGSLVVLLSSVGTALSGLALSAGTAATAVAVFAKAWIPIVAGFALVAVKVALVAAGILTVVVAVDFLVANLKQLPVIAEMGFQSLQIAALSAREAIVRAMGNNEEADKLLIQIGAIGTKFQENQKLLNGGLLSGSLDEIDKFKKRFEEMIAGLKGPPSADGKSDGKKKGGPAIISPEEKAAMEIRIKNFNDLHAQNAMLDLENRKEQIGTVAYLREKNKLEIDALRLKYKDGELGALGTAELEKQIELMGIKNGMAIKKETRNGLESASEGVSGVAGAVGGYVGMVVGIVEAIPNLLSSVAGLMDKMKNLPETLFSGMSELQNSVASFLSTIVPKLFETLPDILFSSIEFGTSQLPKLFAQMIRQLPDAIMGMLEKLPDIVEMFISSFMTSIPVIIDAIIFGFIGNIPKIVVSIVKAILVAVRGIFLGLARGIRDTITMAFSHAGGNLFGKKNKVKIDIDPKSLTESMKKAAQTLTGEASKLFKVVDLTQDPAAAEKTKENITAIEAAGKRAQDWLSEAWHKILSGFGELMTWFSEVWKQLLRSLTEVWNGVVRMLTDVFTAVKDIFNGIITALEGVFSTLSDIGNVIAKGVTDGLQGAGDFFYTLGDQIWKGLSNGLQGLGAMFTNILNSINPSNLFEKMFRVPPSPQGTVEAALGINVPFMNFAKGGVVPGNAQVAGDSLMNDRILALVSPDEAIIPRSKMANPFLGGLVRGVLDGTITPPKFAKGGFLGQVAGHAAGVVKTEAEKARDFLMSLSPTQMWDMVRDKVMKEMIPEMLKANRFHEGGIIGGSGDVPILGQAGEFVMQRSAVSGIGAGNLAAANKAGSLGGGATSNVYNIDIKVDAKTAPDEKFIRGTLLPILKEELRRASLDGQRVLFQSGVRA